MLRRLGSQIGRRGIFLLFLSLLAFLYGWSILTVPQRPLPVHLIMSYRQWGWVWLGVSLPLFAGAFAKRDRVFYGLAAFVMAGWAGAWIDSWWQDPAVYRSWVSVVIWASFAGLVLVVSTWPEVQSPPREGGRGQHNAG